MNSEQHQKVTASHLKRSALLYVRQSTMRQVFENTESTTRQYALRDRAVALGWPLEDIVVVDGDLGHTATAAGERDGFERVVTEVGMGRIGIVLGLEVSRLARNSSDWHRLLEICALADTLILDEDGVYNPKAFNDRLLLGLKGQMSEAEIHVMKARLHGGALNKARRGELQVPLPTGLVYDAQKKVQLDPDKQVQESLKFLFTSFDRMGTATAVMKEFYKSELLFPRRVRKGPQKGELIWEDMTTQRVLQVLHNPRYAGAFVWGRRKGRKLADGRTHVESVSPDEWISLVPGAHDGYITWKQFQDNQQRLLDNAKAHGEDRRKSPPREGPALLQGLVLCGRCGKRMSTRYYVRADGRKRPYYLCDRERAQRNAPNCQIIPGTNIDKDIGELLVEMVTPVSLEVALTVQGEIQSRLEEASRLRNRQVERARYEADLARQRFMNVDPNHRLVADGLEAEWNAKLRDLQEAQQKCEREHEADRTALTAEQSARVLALATDFPKLWRDPKTPQRERKRMARLLIEDVTLIRDDQITAHVRFRGGSSRTLTLPNPLRYWEEKQTSPKVVAEVDKLLDSHTPGVVAGILNQKGRRSGHGKAFTRQMIVDLVRANDSIRSRYQRLREKGYLTQEEMAERLGVISQTVRTWARHGLLRAHPYTDRGQCLYEPPGKNPPTKKQGHPKLADRRRHAEVPSLQRKEM
jgi:DNA invertase Pin-like site-specific DNA recombinase